MSISSREPHPHSAHDRTREWRSYCMEIFMGRDPKLVVVDDDASSSDSGGEEDSLFGGWSAPGYLAINMIEDTPNNYHLDDVTRAHADTWMNAALALSASIDEVSLMIRRKAVSYVSSMENLALCFDTSTESTMTNTDRSIFETTVASFVAGISKQIDSLRQTVVVEGDHPFLKTADGGNSDASTSHPWASGPIGHRAGIASCLIQRLKSEIMNPMAMLHSQRERSMSRKINNFSGDKVSEILQNPMRMFSLETEDSARRSLPPAPWEVGEHDAEKDWAEREQEKKEFLDVYFEDKEMSYASSLENISTNILPPPSVMRFMELPEPSLSEIQQYQHSTQQDTPNQTKSSLHSDQHSTQQNAPNQNIPLPSCKEDEHLDQLQRESAMLLATYQHSDLEGVQKVERNMVEITALLSRFTDLISEQQEDIFTIHDQALKSKENVDKGQDQLVDAANRGEKSKHPMAMFIIVMALLLLFFNWITP